MKKINSMLKSVGPGIIIASACLGPGSITTASKIGTDYGYSLMWVVLLAGICMAMYTSMSARFGAISSKTILASVAEHYGRWFAVLIGVSAFLAATSFQFGNNLGVATALQSLTGIDEHIWPLIISPGGIVLIFYAKSLYKIIEKIMLVLVLIMITAFVINFIFTKPEWSSLFKGFVPHSVPSNAMHEMVAIVGTTFILHSCLYQSYLVQYKGWDIKQLKTGFRDSLIGIIILAGTSLLIIATSATALHPKGISITSAADMALQLETLFGSFAKIVFSMGLFAAAFSSLLVNSIIGGGLLADSLGWGNQMNDKGPKIFATVILLTGMTIAVFFRGNLVYALVLAQASSMLAVPAIAVGLIMVVNNKKIMGGHVNNWKQNIITFIGLVLVFFMVINFYFRIYALLGFGH